MSQLTTEKYEMLESIVSELTTLLAEESVTGVLIEVHRGPLSKSIREYGECSCPTNKKSDVMLEVEHD